MYTLVLEYIHILYTNNSYSYPLGIFSFQIIVSCSGSRVTKITVVHCHFRHDALLVLILMQFVERAILSGMMMMT